MFYTASRTLTICRNLYNNDEDEGSHGSLRGPDSELVVKKKRVQPGIYENDTTRNE